MALDSPVEIKTNAKINVWLEELETQMRVTLCNSFSAGLVSWRESRGEGLLGILQQHNNQSILLSFQNYWRELMLSGEQDSALDQIQKGLALLASSVLKEMPKLERFKVEQLITELVHKRNVTQTIKEEKASLLTSFLWFSLLKYVFKEKEQSTLERWETNIGLAAISYGFEYLGIAEKLVQTPLTDKCYFTLTQAISLKLGELPLDPQERERPSQLKCSETPWEGLCWSSTAMTVSTSRP